MWLRKHRTTLTCAVLALVLLMSYSTGAPVLAQDSGPTGGSPVTVPGAGGVNANQAAAVPGGPGYYSVSVFEFMPYVSPSFASPFPNYASQGMFNPGPGAGVYEAPVNLPNGVTILKLVVYFYDNSGSNLSIHLKKCALEAEGSFSMAAAVSSSESAAVRTAEDTTITDAVIDMASNSYILELSLPPDPNLRILGVRIDYANTSSLPAVLRSAP